MKHTLGILLIIILSFPFIAHSQMGGGAAQYTAWASIQWGGLVSNTTMSGAKQASILKDTLGCRGARSEQYFPQWTGSNVRAAAYQARGLIQIMGLDDAVFREWLQPSELPGFADTINQILAACPYLYGVTCEGEEFNSQLHFGNTLDYIEEIKVMYNICHPKGIYVTDGGIYGGAVYINTYRWLVGYYGQATADLFDALTMTPAQSAAARNPNINPAAQASARQIDTLFTAAPWLDWFNLHTYQPKEDAPTKDTITYMNPVSIRYIKEYIEKTTGRPVICNETCTRGNSLPALVTNMLTEYYRLGFFVLQWYDGTGALDSRPITDPTTGAILPNGVAFRNYVTGHTQTQ